MGFANSRPANAEKDYWRKKNYELWIESKTFKSIRRMLHFMTNVSTFEMNMDNLHECYHSFVYSVLEQKLVRTISLECVDICGESFDHLGVVLQSQRDIRTVRLSFERAHKEETKYHLNMLCKELSLKPMLMNLTLGNWAKAESLSVAGEVLGQVLQSTPLRSLTIQKIEILGFEEFTKGLAKATRLSSLWMQSSSEYKKLEVQAVYYALIKVHRMKRIEMLDKYSHPQIAWKELAQILKDTKRIRELKVYGDDLVGQNAVEELTEALSANASIRHLSFTRFQKSPLYQHIPLLDCLDSRLFLETLDLSYNQLENETLISCLVSVIPSCPNLHALLLSHVLQLREEQRASLVPLFRVLADNDYIELLDLSSNQFTQAEEEALAQLLGANKKLREVSLVLCRLSDVTLAGIFKALCGNSTLSTIDLKEQVRKSVNKMYMLAGQTMAECLRANETLKNIYMGGNMLSDEGSIALATALVERSSAQQVSLTIDGNGPATVEALGQVIQKNTRLEKLTLEESHKAENAPLFRGLGLNETLLALDVQTPLFTVRSLESLGEVLKTNATLHVLKLVGEFEAEGPSKLADGLALNRSVQYMSLASSHIRHQESIKFISFLRTNKALQYLQLYFQVIDIEDIDVLSVVSAIQHNSTLKFLGLSHGSLSEQGVKELKKLTKKNFWLKLEIY